MVSGQCSLALPGVLLLLYLIGNQPVRHHHRDVQHAVVLIVLQVCGTLGEFQNSGSALATPEIHHPGARPVGEEVGVVLNRFDSVQASQWIGGRNVPHPFGACMNRMQIPFASRIRSLRSGSGNN